MTHIGRKHRSKPVDHTNLHRDSIVSVKACLTEVPVKAIPIRVSRSPKPLMYSVIGVTRQYDKDGNDFNIINHHDKFYN
jgi:hypothetical protein